MTRKTLPLTCGTALTAFAVTGCLGPEVGSEENVSSITQAISTIPSNLSWNSSGALVYPHNPNYASVKDATVAYDNGKYHVYATVFNTQSTWQMVYFNFTDWSQANSASQYEINQVSGFSGYNCAPFVMYFPPHNKWYLIYQSQSPRFSTVDNIAEPWNLTSPTHMWPNGELSGKPSLPIDYYVICDASNCHMFFTGDDGKLYRTQTSKGNFPYGWSPIEVELSYSTSVLFEGSSHYKLKDENKYLTVIEAIGSNGRWFAAWEADNLAGPWTMWKGSESSPFAGLANVSFPSGQWTNDISHGEMVRYPNDERSILDTNNMQMVYQGRDPASDGMEYSLLPYRLGLLTATNATGGPPGGGGGGSAVYLEAECPDSSAGAYGSNSTSKSGFSGDGHIMSIDDTAATSYDGSSDDRATYYFSATPGSYDLYVRVDNDGDWGNDSMFYQANGAGWNMVNGMASVGTSWGWYKLGTVSLYSSNTLEIANRENGLGIDKLALVPAGSSAPSGSGSSANNCGSGPVMFQMSGGSVSIEAENHDAKVAGNTGQSFSNVSGVMECNPDSGNYWTSSITSTAPRMEYKVDFDQTGTFYLHVYGTGAHGGNNSVHGGLDGSVVDDNITVNDTNNLTWANGTAFTVNSTGEHTVVIYAREDGVRVDKIIVNKSSGTPSWNGESPRN